MMDSVCTIFRPSSVTQDSARGQVQNFTVLQPVLACSQQQAGLSVQDLYRQRDAMVTTTFYFCQDPLTTTNDLLTATSFYDGQTNNYLVHGSSFPVARGVLWGTDCQLVQSPDTVPIVVLPTVASITDTTALLGGNVTSDGAATLSAVGVVYSVTATNNYPRLGGTGVSSLGTISPMTGVFALTATGLTAATRYSFAPFATNSLGTTYGQVVEFVTEA